jgi:hypothetical protein
MSVEEITRDRSFLTNIETIQENEQQRNHSAMPRNSGTHVTMPPETTRTKIKSKEDRTLGSAESHYPMKLSPQMTTAFRRVIMTTDPTDPGDEVLHIPSNRTWHL